jgi:hypothetical protein
VAAQRFAACGGLRAALQGRAFPEVRARAQLVLIHTSVKAVLGSAWRASFFLLDDVDMAVREKAAELARGLDDVSLPPLRSLQ